MNSRILWEIRFDPEIVMLMGLIMLMLIILAICDDTNGFPGKWRAFLGCIGFLFIIMINTINQLH